MLIRQPATFLCYRLASAKKVCGLTCKINRGQTLLDCKSKLLGRGVREEKLWHLLFGSGNLFMAPLIKFAARYHNINKGSSIAPNKTHHVLQRHQQHY